MHEIDNLSELIQSAYMPIMCGPDTVGEYRISSNVANQLAAHIIANGTIVQRHGHWDLAEDGDGIVCSSCGEDFCTLIHETDRFFYCPHCGSKNGAMVII